jgi:hypothetical protein
MVSNDPFKSRMTTFVETRESDEYLSVSQRPPVYLLRILPAEEMRVQFVETTPITNAHVGLFDSR